MKLLKIASLVLVGLAMFGMPLAQAQMPNSDSNLAVALPLALVEWAQKAHDQAPTVLTAKRTLETARSQYRAGMAQIQGTSLVLDAPVEANEKGIAGSVGASWRQSLGATQITARVGVAESFKWDEELKVGPAVGLSVTHPLGATTDARVARQEYSLRSAEMRYRSALQSFSVELIRAYGAFRVSQLDAHIANLRLDVARRELEVAQLREVEGAASATALHAARQSVALSETSAASAALSVDKARGDLLRLAGMVELPPRGEAPHEWVVKELMGGPEHDDQTSWVNLALAAREDVHLAGQAVKLAQAELADAIRAASLSGELRGGLSFPSSSTSDPELGWYVGAAFTLPLRDSATAEAVVQAQLKLDQALADQDELLRRVRNEVGLAYQTTTLANQHLDQLTASAHYASHLLRVAEEALNEGLGTELEVARVSITVAEMERNVVSAYFDMVAKRVALWHMVGGDLTW